MKQELIGPAALLTVELLRRSPTDAMEATPDVIGSAFEDAYLGLLNGVQRIEAREVSHWEGAPTPGE